MIIVFNVIIMDSKNTNNVYRLENICYYIRLILSPIIGQ